MLPKEQPATAPPAAAPTTYYLQQPYPATNGSIYTYSSSCFDCSCHHVPPLHVDSVDAIATTTASPITTIPATATVAASATPARRGEPCVDVTFCNWPCFHYPALWLHLVTCRSQPESLVSATLVGFASSGASCKEAKGRTKRNPVVIYGSDGNVNTSGLLVVVGHSRCYSARSHEQKYIMYEPDRLLRTDSTSPLRKWKWFR